VAFLERMALELRLPAAVQPASRRRLAEIVDWSDDQQRLHLAEFFVHCKVGPPLFFTEFYRVSSSLSELE